MSGPELVGLVLVALLAADVGLVHFHSAVRHEACGVDGDRLADAATREGGLVPYRHPPEFRRRVLDLLAAGRSLASLCADLGVSDQTDL